MASRILIISVSLLSLAASACGGELPEIDWQGLLPKQVEIHASDEAVRDLLTTKLSGRQQSHLTLEAKSFYNVMYPQQGFPRQRYSLTDALAGREPGRTKFRYTTCGTKIDNTAGKAQNGAIGRDTSMQVANLNSSLSGSQIAGVGIVVGLATALMTEQEKVLSCEEEVTVCPISAMLCTWYETVATNFILYDGAEPVAKSGVVTTRHGRGLETKELAQQHLEKLKAL